MTPAEPQSDTLPRSARAVLVATSLLTLGFLVWGATVRSRYVVLPRDTPWSVIDFPVRVAGVEASGVRDLQLLAERCDVGDVVSLGRAGEAVVEAEVDPISLWVTILCGLAFWGVATFTLGPRIGRPAIADLYAAMLLSALAIMISGPSPPRGDAETVLQSVYLVSLGLLPIFFLRFSLGFPRRRAPLGRLSWLTPTLFLAALAIAGWCIQAWAGWFAEPSTASFLAQRTPTRFLYGLLLVVFPIGLACLYANARSAPLAREQRQAKWILVSIAIGATPFVFVMVVSRLFFDGRIVIPPVVESLGEMMVPAGITIAVVRDRFLDVDVIIRRGVIYTVLVLGAAVVAFLTVVLAGEALGFDERLVWALAAGLPAALFIPARRRVSGWVDRTFFKIRYSHERSLNRLQGALLPLNTQEEVADEVGRFFQTALALKQVGVSIRRGEAWVTSGSTPDLVMRRVPRLLAPSEAGHPTACARDGATAVPEIERDFPATLAEADLQVVQPIAANGALRGVIALGEKRSERRYVEEDLKLVAASALQAGQALERIELTQRVSEEAMKRRHIAELVRQKADFFARVAHDLRTPLTAIRWSVRNLIEELAGPLNQRQSEYLDSVGAAAGQLGRLVDNLVDLSRIDLGAHEQPPEPVDLRSVVESAVQALRPLAEARRARLSIRADDDLPRGRGRTEAAFQIVINLVDNALKYAPEESTVEIGLYAAEDGFIELSVRDHGPGLPTENTEALFDLFARGPESPHATTKGFGIGLHIVREWTHTLGGTVSGGNAEGGGARFVCRLPAWRDTGEPA